MFLSVGFQPAFANSVCIAKTSDIDEYCGCQASNLFRHLEAKMLLIKSEEFKNYLSFKENGKIKQLSLSNNNDKECFILLIKFNIAVMKFSIFLYLVVYLYPIFPSLVQKIEDLAFYYFEKADEFLWTAIDLNCYWVYY